VWAVVRGDRSPPTPAATRRFGSRAVEIGTNSRATTRTGSRACWTPGGTARRRGNGRCPTLTVRRGQSGDGRHTERAVGCGVIGANSWATTRTGSRATVDGEFLDRIARARGSRTRRRAGVTVGRRRTGENRTTTGEPGVSDGSNSAGRSGVSPAGGLEQCVNHRVGGRASTRRLVGRTIASRENFTTGLCGRAAAIRRVDGPQGIFVTPSRTGARRRAGQSAVPPAGGLEHCTNRV